jgi:hypothetical protein
MAAPAAAAPRGLVDRMARTWAAPRAVVRREIDAADEARLLFYAVAASALGALGLIGAQALNPAPGVAADFNRWVVTQTVVGLFFRPLGLYGAAALMALVCRRLGGRGGWRDTRAAVFWTALVAAPAGVALAVLGAAATGIGHAPAAVAAAGTAAGSALWAVLLAPALAEAHGLPLRGVAGAFVGLAALIVLASLAA